VFEVDLHAGELRKQGIKIKLQQQPFRVLALLLEQAGEVVTREDLRQAIWPAGAFVEFDLGLDAAIHKLRSALGDSARTPIRGNVAASRVPVHRGGRWRGRVGRCTASGAHAQA